MSVLLGLLLVLAVAAVGVTAMLIVRRHAPDGSFFADGDRAAGVFGVLATGFAVLAGFVVFLSFESFDTARAGAEAEAELTLQQFETAQFLPAPSRRTISGELVCYARAVVYQEWPALRAGTGVDSVNPWGLSQFRTLETIDPRTAAEQAAYAKYLDQRSDRQTARLDRTHGAEGVIPSPLWIVLFISAGVIFGFMLLFADSGERAFVQGAMIGGVAVVVSSLLLLLWFLDNPYHDGMGTLQPVAMERTLDLLAEVAPVVGGVDAPCDARGVPLR